MERYQYSLPHGYVLQGEKNSYIIDRVLGQGSFGITYLAKCKTTFSGSMGSGTSWTQVAVKEFFMRDMNVRDTSTGYLNDMSDGSLTSKYCRAFVREARNLASLAHPGIVNVFEVIETNNTVYIVMEFIDGNNLDELIASRGRIPEKEALFLFSEICGAVDYLHQQRMLHLDIKPKNIMIDYDGHPRLIDFGLSKQYTKDGEPESSTTIGLGTPGYAPIEQAERFDGDNNSNFQPTIDIYALGATLYKMLTGITPPTASKISESALEGENIITSALSDQGVSDSTAALVSKAMWPSSKKRYQSASELIASISAIPSVHDQNTQSDDDTVIYSVPVHDSAYNKDHFSPKAVDVKPTTPSKKGFPKWLYIVTGVVLIGLAAIFIIPKSSSILTSLPEQIEPDSIAVTSISLNSSSLSLVEGDTTTLIVEYTPLDAIDKSTTWKSSDDKVATVSNDGKVTALKAGNVTITAICGNTEAVCSLKIILKPVPVTTLSLRKSSIMVGVGSKEHIWFDITPKNTTEKMTWKSSDIKIATVSSEGVVSGITTGKTVITLTCGGKEASCEVTVVQTTGSHFGHDWVDLGLSVNWATCNIGAVSPEDYGDFFAWGETETKTIYGWSTYKYFESSSKTFTKYCNDSDLGYYGFVDNKIILDPEDDVAREKWGGDWRMPTIEELDELASVTYKDEMTLNGISVVKIYNVDIDTHIYLPVTDSSDGSKRVSPDKDKDYSYWSSSICLENPRFGLLRGFEIVNPMIEGIPRAISNYKGSAARGCGLMVRPVCPK